MSTLLEITFEDYSCRCPDRSWSFLATVSVAFAGGEFQAHWGDGAGWVPCDTSEEEYTRLYSVLQELNLEAPEFGDWQALMALVTAEANEQPIVHWRKQWLVALDRELSRAERDLEHALGRVQHKRNALLLAESRSVAARIGDPDLASAAHRLLEESWAGSPAELLATAEAVLQR